MLSSIVIGTFNGYSRTQVGSVVRTPSTQVEKNIFLYNWERPFYKIILTRECHYIFTVSNVTLEFIFIFNYTEDTTLLGYHHSHIILFQLNR